MQNFKDFLLPKTILSSLYEMGFKNPTEIQEKTIAPAIEGKDILGTAQTGTGKTGAFAIPMCAKLIKNQESKIIVLTPTRELAAQVFKVFKDLLNNNKEIKISLLIGGEDIGKQMRQLKAKPRVIIGTPGRINDHIKRGTLSVKDMDSLILDETDLMLDMGFDVQIESIIEKIKVAQRQTLLFSATLPAKIKSIADKYQQDPIRVSIGRQSAPGENIKQNMIKTTKETKYKKLLEELEANQDSTIIFVKTKRTADKLAIKLNDDSFKACAIHGDLRQSKRDRVINNFRKEKFKIMVATDVASRGIDIPHIKHVINFDLPQCPEDYIHRIGRTARAGQSGNASTFVTKQDERSWSAIERLIDPNKKGSSEEPKREGAKKRNSRDRNRDRDRNSDDRNNRNNKSRNNKSRTDKNKGYPKRFKKTKEAAAA